MIRLFFLGFSFFWCFFFSWLRAWGKLILLILIYKGSRPIEVQESVLSRYEGNERINIRTDILKLDSRCVWENTCKRTVSSGIVHQYNL
ncbi:hypothetical protein B0J18DRAFT_421864 [Chaetomium sp. MPI-SDFR-AT-0129]|nr:hypothetical protein B0J18DRAFT_421864 [Chaetomium sp. MPI-SDFR-AT-0129]